MALRNLLVACFPEKFERYIEVFGGAAWVLFHKQPTRFEVYNDFNFLLVNLFRFVRDSPDELKEALEYTLNSREDFGYMLKLLKEGVELTDLQRASFFYQIIRFSYASGCTSFSCQPQSMWSSFPAIDACNRRLQQTGVVIENKSFEKLIPHYDREDGFFYLDPPYFGSEKCYTFSNFGRESHELLRDTLLSIDGKFLLSYDDSGFIRELYDHPQIFIMPASRLNNIKQRYDGGSEFKELIIANYDFVTPYKRYTEPCEQLMLA